MSESVTLGTVALTASLAVVTTLLTLFVKETLAERSAKRQFAHRIQFETEYALYQKIWAKTFAAARAATLLHNSLAEPNGLVKDREQDLDKFIDCWNDLGDSVLEHRPFICDDVMQAVTTLRHTFFPDMPEDEVCFKKPQHVIEAMAGRFNELMDGVSDCSTAISKRIDQMNVRM